MPDTVCSAWVGQGEEERDGGALEREGEVVVVVDLGIGIVTNQRSSYPTIVHALTPTSYRLGVHIL